jgi:hypothetical protein
MLPLPTASLQQLPVFKRCCLDVDQRICCQLLASEISHICAKFNAAYGVASLCQGKRCLPGSASNFEETPGGRKRRERHNIVKQRLRVAWTSLIVEERILIKYAS